MRIDSNQLSPALSDAQPAGVPSAGKASASAAAAGSGPVGQDQTDLSGIHGQIQTLVAQTVQLPETGANKLDALRQAVLRGIYRPSPEQTAGALFDSLAVNRAA